MFEFPISTRGNSKNTSINFGLSSTMYSVRNQSYMAARKTNPTTLALFAKTFPKQIEKPIRNNPLPIPSQNTVLVNSFKAYKIALFPKKSDKLTSEIARRKYYNVITNSFLNSLVTFCHLRINSISSCRIR